MELLKRRPNLLALMFGLTSATGFAPLGLWPVTLLCLAGLLHLVSIASDRRAALARGYWFGVGQFTLGLNWIAGSFRYQDAMPVWLGWIAVVLLSLYLAVYPALAGGLAWRWGRKHAGAFVLLFAAAWIATEWLRATMFTGFAWNPLAVSLIDLGGLATLVGTYGLSGVAVLAAGALMMAFRRKWLAAGAFALPLLLSFALSFADVPGPTDGPPQPLVRVVQPNIGQDERNDPSSEARRFARLEDLSGQPGETGRLILWPESSAPGFIESEEWNRARVASILGPKDVLLTGADALIFNGQAELTGAHNSVFAVFPNTTLSQRYDKAHLVPYGEYLALRWLLEPLGAERLVPGGIDFIPGPGPANIDIPGIGPVGVQICYEIIFSGNVIDRANRPRFLFNPSTDSWFGRWGPPQHLAQARLRALEEAMVIVRATPTGISAIIDPRGNVVRSIPFERAGAIEARLPLPAPPTPFALHGNLIAFAFALFLTALGVALRRRAL